MSICGDSHMRLTWILAELQLLVHVAASRSGARHRRAAGCPFEFGLAETQDPVHQRLCLVQSLLRAATVSLLKERRVQGATIDLLETVALVSCFFSITANFFEPCLHPGRDNRQQNRSRTTFGQDLRSRSQSLAASAQLGRVGDSQSHVSRVTRGIQSKAFPFQRSEHNFPGQYAPLEIFGRIDETGRLAVPPRNPPLRN